jgi:guanine deaminase
MTREEIMRRVLDLALDGMRSGKGGPFGTVIVKSGEIIAEGYNRVLADRDPTAHAEVVAIRDACYRLGTQDLSGTELYVNGVPCCMCMSSILWARIDRVHYVLSMEESAAIGLGDDHFYAELARPVAERQIVPLEGLPALRDEAMAVYQEWLDKPDKETF